MKNFNGKNVKWMKNPALVHIVLAVTVLLVGVSASFLLYKVVLNSVIRVSQFQFDREASASFSIVENRIQSYTHVLYALRAKFSSQTSVNRLGFHRFVKSLDIGQRYPGFLALNYAAHVLARDKERLKSSVRTDPNIRPEGYPNFAIKPPGNRPEYFVLMYIEPMEGYEFAMGLDIVANPMAKNPEKVAEAVYRHRDTGNLSASAQPLRIPREKEVTYLAMRLGVYQPGMPVNTVEQRRAAYIGSVGAGFEVESLISAALHKETMRKMRCRIYDVGAADDRGKSDSYPERRLLFDSQNVLGNPRKSESEKYFVYKSQMDIADRTWEFEYSAPRDLVISELDKRLPLLSLGAGLLTTFLLFGIVYTLASSRRRAETIAENITHELRDSERGLAEAQRMARLGSWTLDPANWTMVWSEEMYRLFGLRAFSSPHTFALFLQRVHPEDRSTVDEALRRAISGREDCSIEHRIVLPQGRVRWVQTELKPSTPNYRGQVPGIVMDITERKHAEMDLKNSHEQLQELSRQLVDAQEGERRRISAELHDVVGQNLTALSINLDIIKAQVADDKNAVVRERFADSAQLLRSTTQAIENVMAALRPPMLDDYGLLPALQWYAEQFAARTGIEVKVTGEEGAPRLAPVAEIALFRVTQEALNNVAKHAHAKHVEVKIGRDGSQCVVSVTDDGAGIDATVNALPRRRRGLGMVTMRERMQALGGTVSVHGAAGHGTRVEMRVPC